MQLRNSRTWWGLPHQALHWLTAALIVWMFWLGWTMTGLEEGSIAMFKTYNFHKSLGLTILALALVRLVWRLSNPVPDLPDGMRTSERRLANSVHVAVYVLLFAIPLSGYAITSMAAIPVNWFGLFTVPNVVPATETGADLASDVHEILGLLLLGAIALHVLGALKHQFVDRDDVLKRMTMPAGDGR